MANLAIQGHKKRSKEVIEILEMLGGKNRFYYDGTFKELIYTIGSALELDVLNINSPSVKDDYVVFTLEEFLEKFPYKVGDKVLARGSAGKITYMRWQGDSFFTTKEKGEVVYTVMLDTEEEITFPVEDLQPYKKETMEEDTIRLKPWQLDREQVIIPIPKGYEFAGVDDDNQQVIFEKIKPEYPKTYEECISKLPINWDGSVKGYKSDLLYNFQKLLICRDVYWKLIGWNPKIKGEVFYMHALPSYLRDLFPFPTEEMKDEFYNNFKELLDTCKSIIDSND